MFKRLRLRLRKLLRESARKLTCRLQRFGGISAHLQTAIQHRASALVLKIA